MVFINIPLISFLVTLLSTLVTKIEHPRVNSIRDDFIAQAAKHFGYYEAPVLLDVSDDIRDTEGEVTLQFDDWEPPANVSNPQDVTATLPPTEGMVAISGSCTCQEIRYQAYPGGQGDFLQAWRQFELYLESYFYVRLMLLEYVAFVKKRWENIGDVADYMAGSVLTMSSAGLAAVVLVTSFFIHLALFLGSCASYSNNDPLKKSSSGAIPNNTSIKSNAPHIMQLTSKTSGTSLISATDAVRLENNNSGQMEEASAVHSTPEHLGSDLVDHLDSSSESSDSATPAPVTIAGEITYDLAIIHRPSTKKELQPPQEAIPLEQGLCHAIPLQKDDVAPPPTPARYLIQSYEGHGASDPVLSEDRETTATWSSTEPLAASPQTPTRNTISPEVPPPNLLLAGQEEQAFREAPALSIKQRVPTESVESEDRSKTRRSTGIYICPGARRAAGEEEVPFASLDGNVVVAGEPAKMNKFAAAGGRMQGWKRGDENKNSEGAFAGIGRRKSAPLDRNFARQSLYNVD